MFKPQEIKLLHTCIASVLSTAREQKMNVVVSDFGGVEILQHYEKVIDELVLLAAKINSVNFLLVPNAVDDNSNIFF